MHAIVMFLWQKIAKYPCKLFSFNWQWSNDQLADCRGPHVQLWHFMAENFAYLPILPFQSPWPCFDGLELRQALFQLVKCNAAINKLQKKYQTWRFWIQQIQTFVICLAIRTFGPFAHLEKCYSLPVQGNIYLWIFWTLHFCMT